jgi:hypothetical protein
MPPLTTGEATMSQVSVGVLGVLAAVILPLGAVQFASGRDLATGHEMAASVVNRAVKSDRGNVELPRSEGRTVSIRLESLPDTSVLIRIPYRLEAGDRITKFGTGGAPEARVRRVIACESVVSVLTDIAKQLQPGRCIT